MSKLHKLRSLKQYRHFNKATAGVGILLFAIVGTILIFRSHAATPFASLEPEQGTKTPAATVGSDTTASGGQYVKFGGRTSQPANWFVSVNGTGDCSQANPCGSINAANQKASSGQVIELAAGTYPVQEVIYRPAADAWTQNVVVRPATGATVILNGGLGSYSPRLTYQDITINVGMTFRLEANYNRFDRMTVTGLIIISGDNITIANSRLKVNLNSATIFTFPDRGHIPDRVTLENNEMGPAYASLDHLTAGPGGTPVHNETVHIGAGTNLIIRHNLIWAGATTSSLHIAETGGIVRNVLVENNFIEQCGAVRPVPPDVYCGAYYAFDPDAQTATSPTITVRNNTIRGGVSANPVAVLMIGNLIDSPGNYDRCESNWNYNVLNTGSGSNYCRTNPGTNLMAVPLFAADGWHQAPNSPGINFGVPANLAALDDIDRVLRNCGPIDAGADENCGSALGLPPN